MDGVLPIFFLAVILKIPVLFGMWLIWWAVREEPELEDAGGAEDHSFRRFRRNPLKPRGPRRRGPHGGAAQAQPAAATAHRSWSPVSHRAWPHTSGVSARQSAREALRLLEHRPAASSPTRAPVSQLVQGPTRCGPRSRGDQGPWAGRRPDQADDRRATGGPGADRHPGRARPGHG